MIEETQTQIKLEIKKYIAGFDTFRAVLKRINKIIDETIEELEDKELKKKAKETFRLYVKDLMQKAFTKIGIPISLMIMAFASLETGVSFENIVQAYSVEFEIVPKELTPKEKVTIRDMYKKKYMKAVEKVYNELAQAEPMYDKNISLRNISEMTVRYNRTIKDINKLIESGVNLVVSSVHANCSKRCEPWQGGHYTLDDTYQVVDGIQFQPLSNATDIIEVTKSGKVYKNGHITGFNCRHYLKPYKKGIKLDYVSEKTIEKQRNIDQKMRYYERQVRKWKDQSLMHKGTNKEEYEKAKDKAIQWNKEYIKFAKSNNRKYYPSRTDVF